MWEYMTVTLADGTMSNILMLTPVAQGILLFLGYLALAVLAIWAITSLWKAGQNALESGRKKKAEVT